MFGSCNSEYTTILQQFVVPSQAISSSKSFLSTCFFPPPNLLDDAVFLAGGTTSERSGTTDHRETHLVSSLAAVLPLPFPVESKVQYYRSDCSTTAPRCAWLHSLPGVVVPDSSPRKVPGQVLLLGLAILPGGIFRERIKSGRVGVTSQLPFHSLPTPLRPLVAARVAVPPGCAPATADCPSLVVGDLKTLSLTSSSTMSLRKALLSLSQPS